MTSVNTNIGALIAQDSMSKASKEMDQSIARLSSGLRINTAADDAAGMSIASKMEAQSRGLEQAIRNASDAQSMIDTTEGAHDEITNVLQRLRELAVQSSNDTNTALDRTFLKAETTALINEIDRISSQTQWNNMNVLDGTFASKSFQVGANAGQTVSVSVDTAASASIGAFESTSTANTLASHASDTVTAFDGDITLNGHLGASTITVATSDSAENIAENTNAVTSSTGITAEGKTYAELKTVSANGTVSFTLGDFDGNTAAISAVVTTTDLSALVTSINSNAGTTGITATHNGSDKATVLLHSATGDNITMLDYNHTTGSATASWQAYNFDGDTAVGSAVTLTQGASDSSVVTGSVKFSSVKVFTHSHTTGEYFGATTSATGAINNIATIDIGTVAGAKDAIRAIDGALGKINLSRSDLGAVSNRLDSVISNLSNVSTNTKASMSNIQDADFASETSKLTRAQILNQAATSMLAQANASKQSVLSLLQG
jgi:flagellin